MGKSSSFEDTVKNLLKMKPKPHDEAKGKEKEGRDKPAHSKADRDERG